MIDTLYRTEGRPLYIVKLNHSYYEKNLKNETDNMKMCLLVNVCLKYIKGVRL